MMKQIFLKLFLAFFILSIQNVMAAAEVGDLEFDEIFATEGCEEETAAAEDDDEAAEEDIDTRAQAAARERARDERAEIQRGAAAEDMCGRAPQEETSPLSFEHYTLDELRAFRAIRENPIFLRYLNFIKCKFKS